MIEFRVDSRDLAELERLVEAFPREGGIAARRAINRTLSWVRTRVRRTIANRYGIPQRVLSVRRRVALHSARGSELSGRLWVGLAPIRAAYLGTPRQMKRGARVGKHVFPGAFVAEMPQRGDAVSGRFGIAGGSRGHVGIFQRAPNLARWSVGRPKSSSPNLPIVEQTVSIWASREDIKRIFRLAGPQLRRTFDHEFRFVLRRGRARGAT